MPPNKTAPPSYLDRLLAELDVIEERYTAVLDQSSIKNINLNRRGSGMTFIGFPSWGWVESAPALEARRMELLAQVRDWGPRYRLLFPHPTPEVASRLEKALDHVERWLVREGGDHSIPASIEQSRPMLAASFEALREMRVLLPG